MPFLIVLKPSFSTPKLPSQNANAIVEHHKAALKVLRDRVDLDTDDEDDMCDDEDIYYVRKRLGQITVSCTAAIAPPPPNGSERSLSFIKPLCLRWPT